MNARITVPELAKITGLSNTAVNYHLKTLERKYDIKYLLEIDIEKFGYINYIAFVKFKDKRPTYEEMKKQLEEIPYVQVALTTKGIYDMVLFLVVKATSEARFTLYKLMNLAFSDYEVNWSITPTYPTFGFIPLRNQFFDILKEKAWRRTRENPRPTPDEITEMEYNVIKEMNNDAAADFVAIDRKIGADKGRSNYAYHKLTKTGIIKRATISLNKTDIKYNAIFVVNYAIQKEFSNNSDKILLNILSEYKQQFDTYSFTSDIASPAGIILMAPITKDDDLYHKEQELLNNVRGVNITTLIVTDILIGMLNRRMFDKSFTKQYEILISEYKYDNKILTTKY